MFVQLFLRYVSCSLPNCGLHIYSIFQPPLPSTCYSYLMVTTLCRCGTPAFKVLCGLIVIVSQFSITADHLFGSFKIKFLKLPFFFFFALPTVLNWFRIGDACRYHRSFPVQLMDRCVWQDLSECGVFFVSSHVFISSAGCVVSPHVSVGDNWIFSAVQLTSVDPKMLEKSQFFVFFCETKFFLIK